MSHREQREAAADRLREEFLRTLSEIDRRRHEVAELPQRLAEHRAVIAGAAAVGSVAIGAVFALRTWLHHRRAASLRHARGRLLLHAFQHPETWVPEAIQPRFPWWALAGKVALVAAVAAGLPVGRVLAGRWSESQLRPAVFN